MRSILFLSLTIIYSFIIGCKTPEHHEESIGTNRIDYAQNLSIQTKDQYSLVKISTSEDKTFNYALYKGAKPELANIDAFIKVPIKSIACTSTSQLPAFSLLQSVEKLTGFQGTDWIYNTTLKERVASGLLTDIGQKQGINQELALKMKPDVIMAYQAASGTNAFNILKQAGIPIVYNFDFSESHPLGRAEWIKFTAALIGKEDMADSIFDVITENYKVLEKQSKALENKPTVMTGIMYGDTWYVPGGKNYTSQFIKDAGGQYIWADNSSSNSIALGFENVLIKAQKADLWIGTASIDNYKALKQTDERYSYFSPFKAQTIYSYTKKVNEMGSNDYLESGYSRPDLILADYIKMIHPKSALAQKLSFTYFSPLK